MKKAILLLFITIPFLGFGQTIYRTDSGTGTTNNSFFGIDSGLSITTGDRNVFVGFLSGELNTSGSANTFLGYATGALTTMGENNTFLGDGSGYYNTTGNNNTFVGRLSGFKNLASFNTFVGQSSGYLNTTGERNTFLGNGSGSSNVTGNRNTFVGTDTGTQNLASNNTFLGNSSGFDNTTGEQNTFIGDASGRKNTTGQFNVFLGRGAGNQNATGANNTFVGHFSGLLATGSGNVFIGKDSGYNELGNDKLYIDNSDTSTPLIYGDFYNDLLTINGSLGIGTDDPKAKLEVVGNAGITSFTGTSLLGLLVRGSNSSGTDHSGIDFTGYSSDYYEKPLARIAVKPSPLGSSLLFGTSNSYPSGITNTAMAIDYNGNVGIGTANPESILHVYAQSNPLFELRSDQQGLWTTVDNQNSVISFNSSFVTGGSYPMTFQMGSDEKVRITPEGNVGIGTITPDERLAVNGVIHAKEVRVDLIGWPDFVFADAYKLQTLDAIEKFISKNGHLPNIPSAAEVEKNGIQLGEMNAKLLEKIEELTLHTIQQQKEIKEQQERNKEMEERLKTLEKLIIKSN